jgi:hypothetical protein
MTADGAETYYEKSAVTDGRLSPASFTLRIARWTKERFIAQLLP